MTIWADSKKPCMTPPMWDAASHDTGVFFYGASAVVFVLAVVAEMNGERDWSYILCPALFLLGAVVQYLGPRLLGTHFKR